MKIALLLSIVCASAIITGCSTNRGGTEDEYNSTTGTMQSQPATDPSLPANPGVGPSIPPP
ncbi:MAG TPA: hypothetical protein VH597_03985 [Verrucomicrobiae bacterium]|nr:hypothetical protein [Verrucomicrobiae bacterium]